MSKLTVPQQHQLKIARQTLKMTPEMANIMGGMSYEEAKQIIKKLTGKDVKEQSKIGVSDDQPFFENSVAAIAGFNGPMSVNKKLKEEADGFGTKSRFPIGTQVEGQQNPNGKTYKGKIIGYSKNSDDVYIDIKGKKIRLAGITVKKLSESLSKTLNEETDIQYASRRWEEISSADKPSFFSRVMHITDKDKQLQLSNLKFQSLPKNIKIKWIKYINKEWTRNESLSLSKILNEAIDLSKIPGSASNWLHKNLKNINNLYKDREQLLQYLEPLEDIDGVSKEWYKQFIDNINHLYSKGPNATLQYLHNTYLNGSGWYSKLNEEKNINNLKNFLNNLKKENPNYYNDSQNIEIKSKRLKEKIYTSKYSDNLSYNEIDKIVDNFLKENK